MQHSLFLTYYYVARSRQDSAISLAKKIRPLRKNLPANVVYKFHRIAPN
jgi:hypothetical protein